MFKEIIKRIKKHAKNILSVALAMAMTMTSGMSATIITFADEATTIDEDFLFKIVVVDAEDEVYAIEGAKVRIRSYSGSSYDETFTTDKNGAVTITKGMLSAQTYQFEITDVPDGYTAYKYTDSVFTIASNGSLTITDCECNKCDFKTISNEKADNHDDETSHGNWKTPTYTNLSGIIATYPLEPNNTNYVTEVPVEVIFDDDNNRDGLRPHSLPITLYRNGRITGQTTELNLDASTTHTFTNIPTMTGSTQQVWTIPEETIEVAGYECEVTGNVNTGFTITYTHEPETTTISGNITWDDDSDRDGVRPDSVDINLNSDDASVGTQTITVTGDKDSDSWAYSFEGQYVYRDNGQTVNYTVKEVIPNDAPYVITQNGNSFTNAYTPEEETIKVSKTWDDDDDQDGIRPKEIIIHLYADGNDTEETLTLTENNGWTGEFTEYEYEDHGKEVSYTIEEVSVDGYDSSTGGDYLTGFEITNSHAPETINIEGTVTWDDNNDQDGKRPGSVIVRLMADGEMVKRVRVTQRTWTPLSWLISLFSDDDENESWEYQFTDLPKYRDQGREIEYTVVEEEVNENDLSEYDVSIDGYDIKNVYLPETKDVAVRKVWSDDGDRDQTRPESVTVRLSADNEPVLDENNEETTAELSENNGWSYVFEGLDTYKNGQKIEYSIKEDEVDGYESSVVWTDEEMNEDAAVESFVVVNSHEADTIDITGTVSWNDDDDRDGYRPEEVGVDLYGNGSYIATTVMCPG